jgi:NitT/TauT family transport system substrate-binding protein
MIDLRVPRSTLLRGAAATAITAAAFGARRGAFAQALPKLRVAGIPLDVAAVPYYAQDQGLFVKHGLDVEVLNVGNGAAIAAALLGGSLDIGSANTTVLATSHDRGVPFVMIAPSGAYLSKQPTAAFLVGPNAEYKTPRDLVGKVIGVGALRSVGEIAVRAWFDKGGIGFDGYKLIEVANSATAATLMAERVDAVIAEEPWLSASLAGGAKKIATPYDLIGQRWIEGGFFCSADFVKANTDVCRRFAAAIGEAALWANKSPDATARIIEANAKTTISPSMVRTFYPDRLTASDLQPLIDASAKYGLLKTAFPAKDLFAPGFGS